MPTLHSVWKKRRVDAGCENHWKMIAEDGQLNGWQAYQQKYNFIETDYSERPSNNGLDLANPGFAFTTNLAKFIKT